RHLQILFTWVSSLKPSSYLLGRPLTLQFTRNYLRQGRIAGQFACLVPVRTLPGRLVGPRSSVAGLATVTVELAADGGCRSSQASGNAADGFTRSQCPGYLFAFSQG